MKLAKRSASSQRNRYKNVISVLSCYAAGVFLATCLLDLFPAVEDKIEKALDRAGIYTSYPVSEFLMAFGLFLLLVIEQIVLVAKENHEQKQKATPRNGEQKPLLTSSGSSSRSVHQSGINGGSGQYRVNDVTGSIHVEQPDPALLPAAVDAATEEHNVELDGETEYHDPASHSLLRSIMLLLALSLHSIFEGLAVGLQPSSETVLQIFAALILHKSILAFSLGLNLVQSKMKLSAIIRGNFFFSLTSPLGIGIGIAIDHFEPYSLTSNLINGILQGLACGTFVYVVFFEILPHEFNTSDIHQSRLLKVLFLILGFATVSILILFLPDDIDTHHVGN